MDSAITLGSSAATTWMPADSPALQGSDPQAPQDLLTLGRRANKLRRQLHPEGVVTYTNAATITCPMTGPAHLDVDKTLARVAELVERGASGITMLFAPPSDVLCPTLKHAEELIRQVRAAHRTLSLQAFSAETILAIAADQGLDTAAVIARLQTAGLDSIGPADYRTDVLTIAAVDRAAHRAGMRTCAVLPVLPTETTLERANRLDTIALVQAETGGYMSLAVTAPSPKTIHLSDELTAVEFLTALATARLALPSILHVESSWPTQGLKLLQMALRFGADDAGSVHLDRTITAPGPDTPAEEDLRRIIRDAGFMPVERSSDYSSYFVA